jgi:hypothetical protein
MTGREKFLLLDAKNFIPSTQQKVLLGRICDNVNQPWSNYVPEDPSPFYSKSAEPFHIEAQDASLFLERATDSATRVQLDKLLGAERTKARTSTASWHGQIVRIFSLPQEKQVLRNILAIRENLSQAEEWLNDNVNLYMITGFISVVNVTCQGLDASSSSGAFNVCLTEAMEAALVAAGIGPLDLPSLEAKWKRSNKALAGWRATHAGEHIIAVRSRQLDRTWKFLSKLVKGQIKLRGGENAPGDGMFGHGQGK